MKKYLTLIICLLTAGRVLSQENLVTLKDIDGNVYKTVTIGTQVWIAENLKTTRFNDGIEIPLVTANKDWDGLSTPGYCWFANDMAVYGASYGALYNWHSVNSGKLCPIGWHVPTDAEWHQMVLFLDNDAIINDPSVTKTESLIAGGKLKESGTIHWQSPNTGATNESGFTGLPGGYRLFVLGGFWDISNKGEWWSSTEFHTSLAFMRSLDFSNSKVERACGHKSEGYSIRCLKH